MKTITIEDLRARLATEEDPQVRKILKDTIVYLTDPDPLTVSDDEDLGRVRPNRNTAHLRNEHPGRRLRSVRDLVASIRRRLDRAPVDPYREIELRPATLFGRDHR